MPSKILIIEKEPQTLNTLSWLLAALNLKNVIVHKWPTQIRSLNREALAAVFVDVELGSVDLEKVEEDFSAEGTIPLFYMYTRTFAPRYQWAKKRRHADSFKKPLRLENVYASLQKYLKLNDISSKKSETHAKLTEFLNYSDQFENWLQKFGSVLQNPEAK